MISEWKWIGEQRMLTFVLTQHEAYSLYCGVDGNQNKVSNFVETKCKAFWDKGVV